MATTKIWAIKSNLKRVVEYAANEEKTTTKDDLRDVLDYASNSAKTNQLVSGINCSLEGACEQMKATKKRAGKTEGVQAYHGYQSFAPGEVDAVTCHKIGVETVKRMWGDEFEVIVCTHTNTDNMHNHFVVNSVSWKTFKKFDNSHEDYRRFRKISDEVCKEFGLSTIENPMNTTMNYNEFKAMIEGKPYIRGMVKEDVELAIKGARTMSEFYKNMQLMGYTFRNLDRTYLTVITPDGDHHVRLDKIRPVGQYSKKSICDRILDNEIEKWKQTYDDSFVFVTIQKANTFIQHNKLHGLKALYVKYQFMLGILPKNNAYIPVHKTFREDLFYLDQITKEVDLIEKHSFESVDELDAYEKKCRERYDVLLGHRQTSYSRRNRCKDPAQRESYGTDIEAYTDELKEIRNDIALCEGIKRRSKKIVKKFETVESEANENECRRGNSRPDGKDDSTRD